MKIVRRYPNSAICHVLDVRTGQTLCGRSWWGWHLDEEAEEVDENFCKKCQHQLRTPEENEALRTAEALHREQHNALGKLLPPKRSQKLTPQEREAKVHAQRVADRERQRAYREARWEHFCSQTYKGALSGNAQHAIECRNTPLEAKAILDLVMDNIGYFGDHYYKEITEPVTMRVEEFYESVGEKVPD